MEPQEMKDTVRRWFQAIFDNGDYSLIPELTTEDYGLILPRTDPISREDLPGMIEGFRSAIPGYRNEIHEQVVEGNVVVTRGTTHATHTGPFGELPPTGNVIESDWITITRFDGDKIAEDLEVWDEMGMMMKLGAIKPVE